MEDSTYEKVVHAREQLRDQAYAHWIQDDLYSLNWWFLLAATILPWIVWAYLRDKRRTTELLTHGLLWAVVATVLDVIGGDLVLWGYPDKLLPMVPHLFPADVTVIPIVFMFAYQLTGSFRSYAVASLVCSALFAYGMEPIFLAKGLFYMHNWRHTYSLIGFFVLALAIKALTDRLVASQRQSQS